MDRITRIARKVVCAIDANRILKDVNSTMRGDEFEDASIQNGSLRLRYCGKAYGDGYDFNERYVNGRFVDGSHGDMQRFSPLFEKQAKYIYEKYKVSQIVVYGYFD